MQFTSRLLWTAALPFLLTSQAGAGASVGFGSSVGALNMTSLGYPLDAAFQFELGCFTPGFVPDRDNTSRWAANWKPFPGGTAAYRTLPLGDPFPQEMKLNSFSGSAQLLTNQGAFAAGAPVYLWGFDRRAQSGLGEWILLTDPSWVCPDGSSLSTATSYDVASATVTVVGAINENGVEMQTDAIALSNLKETWTGWQLRNFGLPAQLLAGAIGKGDKLADPDRDGACNLMEYYLGTDPAYADRPALAGPVFRDGVLAVYHRRSLLATGGAGGVEWSRDLKNWSTEGLTLSSLGGDAQGELLETAMVAPVQGAVYFRLRVEE